MVRLYPEGKRRAFNISYDDGVLQDKPFVEMLDYYGLKGTFNLNSGAMEREFSWIHPSGMTVTRLSPEEAKQVYEGHEVASHTVDHPYLQDMPLEDILWQLGKDKAALEGIFGREVAGFAVPFSYHSDLISRCARHCGFAYSRISECSHSYDPWQQRYRWKAGIFHLEPELTEFVTGFFATEQELPLCQIVGHSYDLDAENLWSTMELICAAVSGRQDVWACTHWQLVQYLSAMASACTQEGILNNSDMDLWFAVEGKTVCLKPGQSLAK